MRHPNSFESVEGVPPAPVPVSVLAGQIGELLLCFLSFPGVGCDGGALRDEGGSNASLAELHVFSPGPAVQLRLRDTDFPCGRPPPLRAIIISANVRSLPKQAEGAHIAHLSTTKSF